MACYISLENLKYVRRGQEAGSKEVTLEVEEGGQDGKGGLGIEQWKERKPISEDEEKICIG